MSVTIKEMEIRFNSEWFQSGYYVYVISITHISKGIFYYIGQTGDRNNKSARSPFYRLMGHYNTYGRNNFGTDAQLVKGLVSNGLIEMPSDNKKARICIEEAIVNKTVAINADFFNISDFNITDHDAKRKNVEEIEAALIKIFSNNKLKLFNDPTKIGAQTIVSNTESIEQANKIFKILMRKKGSKNSLMQLVRTKDFTVTINRLIKPVNASITIYDKWIPDANNAEKEAELKDFLKYNFSHELGEKIHDWWLAVKHPMSRTPNWDLISTCTIDGKKGLLLVEAKAHADELHVEGKSNDVDASADSERNHERIGKAIEEASVAINKKISGILISSNTCYQLSNRVANAWWLANQGVPVVLMYLGFLNCQDMNDGKRKLFVDDKDWQNCFKEHAQKVGVDKLIDEWADCGKSKFITICRSY
jgi:hypothetical protein